MEGMALLEEKKVIWGSLVVWEGARNPHDGPDPISHQHLEVPGISSSANTSQYVTVSGLPGTSASAKERVPWGRGLQEVLRLNTESFRPRNPASPP